MPEYDFVCDECGSKITSKSSLAPECPRCRVKMRRIYTPPLLILNSEVKTEQLIDEVLRDYYRGQEELGRGELTDMEMEVTKELLIERARKLGKDPGYFLGSPPVLTEEQMRKKAQEQFQEVKKYLPKGALNDKQTK